LVDRGPRGWAPRRVRRPAAGADIHRRRASGLLRAPRRLVARFADSRVLRVPEPIPVGGRRLTDDDIATRSVVWSARRARLRSAPGVFQIGATSHPIDCDRVCGEAGLPASQSPVRGIAGAIRMQAVALATDMTVLLLDQVRSPLGTLTLVSSDRALCALAFAVERARTLAVIHARFPGAVFT